MVRGILSKKSSLAAQGGPREEEVGEATAQTGDEATAAEATAEAVAEVTAVAGDEATAVATVVAEEAPMAIKAGGRAAPTKDTSHSRLPREAAEMGTMRPWMPAMTRYKTMMRPYWQKFGGRVRFDQILNATNMNVWDLPRLDKRMDGNGKNRLCWPNVLGCCFRANCSFIHENGRDLPEASVKDACLRLKNGVRWVVDNERDLRVGPFHTSG